MLIEGEGEFTVQADVSPEDLLRSPISSLIPSVEDPEFDEFWRYIHRENPR